MTISQYVKAVLNNDEKFSTEKWLEVSSVKKKKIYCVQCNKRCYYDALWQGRQLCGECRSKSRMEKVK